MSCVRRDYELPLCEAQITSAASKTEPPLGKADPTSNADGTILITYLRKDKKVWMVALQENEKNMQETVQQKLGSVKEGRRCSRHDNKHSPQSQEEDHGKAGCFM